MAQVKLLKIASGLPTEMDTTADEITLLTGQFGNVKLAGNAVTSEDTNGDLTLTPNGTGNLVLDGVNWPQADGSADQILKTDGAGQLSYVDAFAEDIELSYTTDGVGVTIRDAVYISAADVVTTADASAASTARVIGFATSTVGASAAVTVRKAGTLGGFTGLTAGARQFLSETAGEITETAPTTSGAVVFQMGYAKNTTTLDIQFEFIGVRT